MKIRLLCVARLSLTKLTPWQVEQYCFRAPYITEMLRQGLGVSAQQIRIGGGEVAWTLGANLSSAVLRLDDCHAIPNVTFHPAIHAVCEIDC